MLQTSRMSAQAELIRSLNTMDDSSDDEDAVEFEERITFSRIQENKHNLTILETTVRGATLSQAPGRPAGGLRTPVPKQDDSHDSKSSKNCTKSPIYRGQPVVANPWPHYSFPATTATSAVRQLKADSSVYQPESRKRNIESDDEPQADKKKRRLATANTVKKLGGTNSIDGSARRSATDVEIIDVDALSDEFPGHSHREAASSSASFESAVGMPAGLRGESGGISPPLPPQTLLLKEQFVQPPSHRSGASTASCQKAPQLVQALNKSTPLPDPRKLTQKEIARLRSERMAREKRMTYRQFIEALSEKSHERKNIREQYFVGFTIFFGERMEAQWGPGRDKLDLLFRHGAAMLSNYDEDRLTHIVTAGWSHDTIKMVNENIFKGTGKSVAQIPLRIKIVSWSWVAACINAKRLVEITKFHYIHAYRWEREQILLGNSQPQLSPIKPRRRPRGNDPLSSEEEERRERAVRPKRAPANKGLIKLKSPGPPRPPLPSSLNEDPLAEFYGAGSSDEDSEVERQATRWKTFRCMQKGRASSEVCPNQDVIDKFVELQKLHDGRPDSDEKWKGMNMMKAIGLIRKYPKRFETVEEAKAIYGIGDKTARKVMEIINTGALKRLDYERTEQTVVSEKFRQIYGVGPQLATRWFTMGLRTLDDVAKEQFGIKLTSAQKMGLKHYDDLRSRMPREEAKAIYDKVAQIALSLDPKLLMELMGSYRRGSKTCGDIDILITRSTNDGFDHSGILPRILDKLHAAGIIVADLGGESGDDLETKYMGICRLSPSNSVRRIDILCIPYEQWGGALVYFTGDDIFNRSMRLLANKKGMSLNQRGLWGDVIRDPKTKLKTGAGTLIASRTEKDIFAALGVPWQEPHERIRG